MLDKKLVDAIIGGKDFDCGSAKLSVNLLWSSGHGSLLLAFSQPTLGVEQLALIEGPDFAGQLVGAFAFADGFIELAGHGLHLGVEVVEEAEGQGFGNHGQLGRAELQLAVMAEDHVQHQRL